METTDFIQTIHIQLKAEKGQQADIAFKRAEEMVNDISFINKQNALIIPYYTKVTKIPKEVVDEKDLIYVRKISGKRVDYSPTDSDFYSIFITVSVDDVDFEWEGEYIPERHTGIMTGDPAEYPYPVPEIEFPLVKSRNNPDDELIVGLQEIYAGLPIISIETFQEEIKN